MSQKNDSQLENRLTDLSNKFLTDVISEIRKDIMQAIMDSRNESNLLSQNEHENAPDYLSRKDAAKLLNCSLTTLYYYQKKQLIPYYQIGRKVLFNKSELLFAINSKNYNTNKNVR